MDTSESWDVFVNAMLQYQTLLCMIVRHTSSVNITCPTLNALALLCPKNGLMERETVVQILPTKKYPKVVQKMIQQKCPLNVLF